MLVSGTIETERRRRSEFLAWALEDFRRFCGILQIQPKSGGGRQPFRLTWVQQQYNANRTARDIILKPRQVGVTTLEAARDIWFFLTKPGARVVVVCQSQTDQAPFKDVSEKFRLFFDSLARAGLRLEFGRESFGEWSLPKRDSTLRIIQAGASEAAAAKKGRAGTVNRLHITEAAFFEHAETTFNSILESVPGPEFGSEVVNESTPNGVGGFYYEQWQSAVRHENGYTPHFFRWWEHPEYSVEMSHGETVSPSNDLEKKLSALGVKSEQLKWYRRKSAEKGKDLTSQEYPSDPDSCFLVSGRSFFDPDLVTAHMRAAKPPLRVEAHGALRVWKEPVKGAQYVIGADTAEGLSGDGTKEAGDYCAAPIFDRETGEHVATLHGHWTPGDFARVLAATGTTYNDALIAVERNNHGHAVLLGLEREQKYRYIYRHDDDKLGWPTNQMTRPVVLDKLDDGHRQGFFRTNDTLMLGEMRTFVVTGGGRAEAAKGAHDDLVMGGAIAWTVRGKPLPPRGIGTTSLGFL